MAGPSQSSSDESDGLFDFELRPPAPPEPASEPVPGMPDAAAALITEAGGPAAARSTADCTADSAAAAAGSAPSPAPAAPAESPQGAPYPAVGGSPYPEGSPGDYDVGDWGAEGQEEPPAADGAPEELSFALRAFDDVLAAERRRHGHLFSPAELAALDSIAGVGAEGRALFVALAGRKYRWLRLADVSARGITDTAAAAGELAAAGLCERFPPPGACEEGSADTWPVGAELLDVLSAPQLRQICRAEPQLRHAVRGAARRSQMASALLAALARPGAGAGGQQLLSAFAPAAAASAEHRRLRQAVAGALGSCVRVSLPAAKAAELVHRLATLRPVEDELADEAGDATAGDRDEFRMRPESSSPRPPGMDPAPLKLPFLARAGVMPLPLMLPWAPRGGDETWGAEHPDWPELSLPLFESRSALDLYWEAVSDARLVAAASAASAGALRGGDAAPALAALQRAEQAARAAAAPRSRSPVEVRSASPQRSQPICSQPAADEPPADGDGEPLGSPAPRSPSEQLGCGGRGPVFSALYVHLTALSHGVPVCEVLKDYARAARLLRLILSFPWYRPRKRGHWWGRLCLAMDHRGRRRQAQAVASAAMRDPLIAAWRPGDRLEVERRTRRLSAKPVGAAGAAATPDTPLLASLPPPREALVDGDLDHSHGGYGTRRWVRRSAAMAGPEPPPLPAEEGDPVLVCVEDLAREAYRRTGKWPKGTHSEGAQLRMLYSVLLWDAIFDTSVPGAFLTRFQMRPLDFHHPQFFPRREGAITERCAEVAQMDAEELADHVRTEHRRRRGLLMPGASWDRCGEDDAAEVARCIGGRTLSLLMLEMARRGQFSGLPDLLLWDPERGAAMASEVKGPGDRLSDRQEVWLARLTALGLPAEVCKVRARNPPPAAAAPAAAAGGGKGSAAPGPARRPSSAARPAPPPKRPRR
eukprot:TRINITY_DN15881_c0_g2_i1.p1 TRINITY_DN15881_c0_g2~~TRINITY_DN15881_c0_g2_i1.p1  ORF type:complete len:933 (+),score=264.74 TRINITY_DN15881_c0_g2_i1:78-2876(+)